MNGGWAEGFAVPGLWPSVWKLLRLRLVILGSGFRRAKTRTKVGYVFLGLFVLGILAAVFVGSWFLLRLLRSPQLAEVLGDTGPFLVTVPALVTTAAFLAVLVTSFGVLLQALYLAGDMDFLLSAPVPIRAVFIAKLLQAVLPNFSLICLLALPVLFGLGVAGGYNFLYYPLVLVVLAALALAAAGLASLLVMFVVRIFPARRVAEVLGFIGAISSFICSQSGQFARFSDVSQDQATLMLDMMAQFATPWSPLSWAGRGLVDLGEGRWLSGVGFLGLALSVAAVAFGLALSTAERLYYSGWAGMQNNRRKKKAPARATQPRPLAAWLSGWVSPPVRAILVKDYYVLRRDLRNMSQLVTPLILGIVYAVMFLRSGGEVPAGRGEAPDWFMAAMSNIMLYGNVGLAMFVGWMLLARLAVMGFSHEGKSYWLLKTAPVSAGQLLSAKFIVAFLPTTLLCSIFLLVVSVLQGATLESTLFMLLVVVLILAGNTGVNLFFGVVGANMAWEDPRQMQKGAAGCLGALVSFVYLPFSMALFFLPPLITEVLRLPLLTGEAAGLVLGGGFSLVCAIVPVWLLRKRVDRLGEE